MLQKIRKFFVQKSKIEKAKSIRNLIIQILKKRQLLDLEKEKTTRLNHA